jgi:hypothetical protein
LAIGEQAYRIEQPHPDFTNVTFTDFSPDTFATICFNDPDGARSLVKLFDSVWPRCRPIN